VGIDPVAYKQENMNAPAVDVADDNDSDSEVYEM
jgi:hypothetical protein